MRLIDADKLLRDIEHYNLSDGKFQHWVEIQPTGEPKPHWIPCTPDMMPEDGERVLCTHLRGLNPNRQVIEHIYQDGQFTLGWEMDMNPGSPTFGQRYMGKVVAWMPLPDPWKEGEVND